MVKAYGLLGGAMAVAMGGLVHWLVGLVYLRRYAAIGFREFMSMIWRPIWTALVMSSVVVGMSVLLDTRTLIGLSTTVVFGIATYMLLNVHVLRELKNVRLA